MNSFIEQGYSKNGGAASAQISETVGSFRKNYRPAEIYDKLPIGFLTVNHLLGALSRDVFANILPYLETVSFKGNESINQPGDSVDYIYFPESAVISEFQILEDGGTIEIAMTGREGVVGLLSAFNAYPAVNWTQVSVPGKALKIKSRFLREEIYRSSSLQKCLLDHINIYIGQISQRAVCNSRHSLEERFCSWLLMLCQRRKSGKLPLTQEQIARCLGVHRPSVTHIAQNLRERGAIDYRRGKIIITSQEKLQACSCSCYIEADKSYGAVIR
jgi:CRP-like cAMP-binding protein